MNKFPSFSQWKQIFKVLKKKEKITFLLFSLIAFCSFAFLIGYLYINNTVAAPAFGGAYVEGVVGQPRFINPIYGETNDIDRSVIDLVFSGLMTYDKDGKIEKDLVSDYRVSDNGKIYNFTLKNNLIWHDGKPLTADDVLFTIKTIQNSDYKSPLRTNWIDVNVEKISDKEIQFTLKSSYHAFLENCTLKIIPKHIWESISPENFTFSSYNLQPIGSGAFQFRGLTQTATGFIDNTNLVSNRRYYNNTAFIAQISFKFFEKKEDLIRAANAREINGFTLAAFDNNELDAQKSISQGWQKGKFLIHSFSLPRYFAVFFNNQKPSILSDENIRKALVGSVNKDELLKKVSSETKTNILNVDSPILSDFYGYQQPSSPASFDIETAKKLLDIAGFKDNGQGMREKPNAKKPAFQFKSYLKIGSKGTEVTQLQACLARLDANLKTILQNEKNGEFGTASDIAVTEFQKKYLPDLKPTGETGKATRDKLNAVCTVQQPNVQPLKFTLVTVNQPQLVRVANLLKNYWQAVGVQVDVNALSITDLKPIIKSRSYDALLYGEALGADPDLYPFWHSSQKVDPGLNLSSYENKTVDQLLKDARETLDESVKKQKYEQLQDVILKNAPALFLYNPDYVYWTSKQVQGIDTVKIVDPAKRFANITNWYIVTHRVWK